MADHTGNPPGYIVSQEMQDLHLHNSQYQIPSSEFQVPQTQPDVGRQNSEYRRPSAVLGLLNNTTRTTIANSNRVLPGAERIIPSNPTSPIASPRTPERISNYNIDASSSTYALQVALKNMKERYQKLQKRIGLLEDENQRLIHGKSELFGEIGKMQENSIKLREKNLQLNQEVHSQHQESCSLKEKFTTLSQENIKLTHQLAKSTQENRRLNKQINQLNEENSKLCDKIRLVGTQVRALPGGPGTTTSTTTDELESFDSPPSRFQSSSLKDLDEYEQISDSEALEAMSLSLTNSDDDGVTLSSIQTATQCIKNLVSQLQEQKQSLLLLSPIIHSIPQSIDSEYLTNTSTIGGHNTNTHGQRDRDISTLIMDNLKLSDGTRDENRKEYGTGDENRKEYGTGDENRKEYGIGEDRIRDERIREYDTRDDNRIVDGNKGRIEDEEEDTCISRLATCGSVINPNNILSANGRALSPQTDDSGGDNNVIIGREAPCAERPRSPFDWRQVQVSDEDDFTEDHIARPEMRTVSTSPDPTLTVLPNVDYDDEDRTCPMCRAVFPHVITQEIFESHVVSHFESEN